jgi:OFA family oxalate/formate antiporter-like MFS transporter
MVERSGWRVVAAGTGINLALGVLYTWSVIKGGIPESWQWSNADKALPYSVACLCFAIAMVIAGRLQDRIGPRLVATVGGVLIGIGCLTAGASGSSLTGFVAGFGVLAGTGIGFCYAAATPPAVKWFPPRRTGMVAGIVVAGFGIAPVYIAPLVTALLKAFAVHIKPEDATPIVEKSVSATMLVLGAAFLIAITLLAQLLKNPPPGHVPASTPTASASSAGPRPELGWRQVLSTRLFYVLWLMLFAGAAAGLTFISVAQDLGKRALGEWAFFAVVVLAIGNASGRVLGGVLSDIIGRERTLFAVMVLQALVVLAVAGSQRGAGWSAVLPILLLLGANYGANLALFPAATKDAFGLASFGINYGLVFSAWGAAGLVMPWLAGTIKDTTGSSDLTYGIIIALLLCAAGLTFVSHTLARRQASAT